LAGQYEDALEELKKIAPGSINNPVIQQDVGYYTAYCLANLALKAGGDKAVAIENLKGFIGANRNTFHFFEGVELLGDLNFAAGDYKSATTFYGLLAGAPWPEYKMSAAVLQGRAQAAAGDNAAALANFTNVLNSGLNTPEAMEQKMQATVGKAVCMAATGQHEEGIKLIQGLIAKNDPNDADLFGRAYNALGACYEKTGQTKEALLAYLHTDVLYFTNAEAHAEALYHLSKLWAATNKADRAVRARSLLQSRYPGSRWAGME
jgi:tetratricopeptide (TPR) repeat protein